MEGLEILLSEISYAVAKIKSEQMPVPSNGILS